MCGLPPAAVFARLKVPVTCLAFLGIEPDSGQMCLRLPLGNIFKWQTPLAPWRDRRYFQFRELRSVVGKPQHASEVARPGRTFLRRSVDWLKDSVARHQSFMPLNIAFRSHLAWWQQFVDMEGGLHAGRVDLQPPDVNWYTDAADELGHVLPGHGEGATALHFPPTLGQARTRHRQILSGSDSVRENSPWVGKPCNSLHASGGAWAERCQKVHTCQLQDPASDHPGYPAGATESTAVGSESADCENVVGGSMPLFRGLPLIAFCAR